MNIVIVGAGVAGLGSALALSRDGHRVTLLERDHSPMPPSADHAFDQWHRKGAPQVYHSHAFLARVRNLLRDRAPDVLARLLAEGATELRFAEMLPVTMPAHDPMPGDEDLVALACRRLTFEWVLRRVVLDEGRVELRDHVTVTGLIGAGGDDGYADGNGGHVVVPTVTGVMTDAGPVEADLVVDAGGRLSPIRHWLVTLGAVEPDEDVEDTGIVYFSRFYRLCPGAEAPVMEGPIGGDLGYLKYAVFTGDNGTFSITIAVGSDDDAFRKPLGKEAPFRAAAAVLPPTAPWVEPGRAEPITGINVMARLLNQRRLFVTDGRPVARGIAVVGDAAICTNPLYGRGCALGMVHAYLLADALRDHPHDPDAFAVALHDATIREIEPWYLASVAQDRATREVDRAQRDGREPDANDPAVFMRTVVREGLLPATRIDPIVFRAFIRAFNLLQTPDALMADADVAARVFAVLNDKDNRPPEPDLGPPREEMLAILEAALP